MQQASLTGLAKTLFIIVLIYYGLKIIGRFVFPLLFKKVMGNVEKKFNEQQGRSTTNQQHTKEGETVIDKAPRQTKKINDNAGEYVDYEEIE